jgi:tetratricopeptide (TPR) repeat protein
MIARNTKCLRQFVVTLLLFAGTGLVSAQSDRANVFARRAEAEFHRTQTGFESTTNDPAAAWQFARACFDFADFATNDTRRAALANQGIAACRQVLARDMNSVAAHYYLAMNLGQLARTESLGALKIVKEMEREFKTAAGRDAHFDCAGPVRNLGLLYRNAPGWPASIGSRRKAREWLERAVKLAPDYPENHLNLIESRLQWSERDTAARELKTLDALWPDALTHFVGEAWEQSWADWSTRRDAVRKKISEIPPPAKSPRNTR